MAGDTTIKSKGGRPVGTGPVAQLRRQMASGGKLDKLIEHVWLVAMHDNDMAAARIILDRLIPPLRAVHAPVSLKLPDGTLTEQAQALMRAATDGSVEPDVAAELLGALGKLAGIDAIDDLKRQVAALERAAYEEWV